jgi:hypothetical protein
LQDVINRLGANDDSVTLGTAKDGNTRYKQQAAEFQGKPRNGDVGEARNDNKGKEMSRPCRKSGKGEAAALSRGYHE